MRTLMSRSTSANLDGAIGHATLPPQGDHSRTQLVLTPQSLNLWTSSQGSFNKLGTGRKNVAFGVRRLPSLLPFFKTSSALKADPVIVDQHCMVFTFVQLLN